MFFYDVCIDNSFYIKDLAVVIFFYKQYPKAFTRTDLFKAVPFPFMKNVNTA